MSRQSRNAAQQLQQFFQTEAAGGVVMLCCAGIALILANSTFAPAYQAFVHLPLSASLGSVRLGVPLETFVKDVLMAIFFLAVGMELKHEMCEGHLARRGQKLLPLLAALGGIAVPALIYLALNRGLPMHTAGWAIPTATDIAFAVCVVSLAGARVPSAAKVFLLAIAIYDDLAAIIIIATFYSHGVVLPMLAMALLPILGLLACNRLHVTRLWPYLLFGAALWYCVHASGVHSTVAGMLTGLLIPLASAKGQPSPLHRLLGILHPWVAFGILPLFALVAAGVSFHDLTPATLTQPLPLGIAMGLFFGKQLGIFSATYLAIKTGLAAKPQGTDWAVIYGIALVAGVGFTMSLFIGSLAFASPELQDQIKLGVMGGSLISACMGLAILKVTTR